MTEESTNKPAESMMRTVELALVDELARQKCAASAGADLISGVIPPLDMAAMARAAIAAMRAYTQAMSQAGGAVTRFQFDNPDTTPGIGQSAAERCWLAMIAEALNEGEKGGGG